MRLLNPITAILVALVFGATSALAQTIDPATIPACAKACLDNMKAKFGDFQCVNGDDFLCLCRAPAWREGLAECAAANCEGEASEGYVQVTAFANEKCAVVTGTPAEEAPATEEPATPEESAPPEVFPPPPETAAENPDAAPTEAPVDPAEPATTDVADPAVTEDPAAPADATSVPPAATDVQDEATATAVPTSEATNTETSTSEDADSTSTTSGIDSDSNDDANDDDSNSSAESSSSKDDKDDGEAAGGSGLSNGAKIGIGVGAGAALVIMTALIIALCMRRRDRKKDNVSNEKNLEISSPMPGSGRSYASDEASMPPPASSLGRTKSGNRNDLELTSTRYENMVPRTQPSLTQIRN